LQYNASEFLPKFTVDIPFDYIRALQRDAHVVVISPSWNNLRGENFPPEIEQQWWSNESKSLQQGTPTGAELCGIQKAGAATEWLLKKT